MNRITDNYLEENGFKKEDKRILSWDIPNTDYEIGRNNDFEGNYNVYGKMGNKSGLKFTGVNFIEELEFIVQKINNHEKTRG